MRTHERPRPDLDGTVKDFGQSLNLEVVAPLAVPLVFGKILIEVPVDKRTKMIAVFSPEIRILVLRFHAFRCLKSREYKLRVVCGLEVSPGL